MKSRTKQNLLPATLHSRYCFQAKDTMPHMHKQQVQAVSKRMQQFLEEITRTPFDELDNALRKCSLEEDTETEFPELPDDAKTLLKSMRKLECPFTWKPFEDSDPDPHINRIEEKLEEIAENDDINILWHTFFLNLVACYEYYRKGSVEGALFKQKKMEDILNQGEENVSGNSCEVAITGLQHVVLSCQCFILLKLKKYTDAKSTYDKIVLFCDMDNKDKASVWGTRAAVYMEYGYNGDILSLNYIERAIKLDENQAEWHFLQGKVLGRIRRINRSRSVPEEKEINALQKAFDLTGYVPYMLFLAQVYRETAYVLYTCHKDNFQMFKAKCENMNDRAYTLYKNALDLRKDCSHVNLRCAQGILKMPREYQDMELAGSCIMTALRLGPTNPMAHHVAGNYYKRMNKLEKAREHYRKAAESGVYGGYMDLIRLNSRIDPDYDPVPEFDIILERFNKEKPLLLKTYIHIGSYWYFVKNDFKKAFKYWEKPLSEDPTSHSITAHTSLFHRMHTPVNIHDIVFNEAQLQLKTGSISPEESKQMLDLVQGSKSRPLNSPISFRKKVLDEIAEAETKFFTPRGREGQAGIAEAGTKFFTPRGRGGQAGTKFFTPRGRGGQAGTKFFTPRGRGGQAGTKFFTPWGRGGQAGTKFFTPQERGGQAGTAEAETKFFTPQEIGGQAGTAEAGTKFFTPRGRGGQAGTAEAETKFFTPQEIGGQAGTAEAGSKFFTPRGRGGQAGTAEAGTKFFTPRGRGGQAGRGWGRNMRRGYNRGGR